MTLRTARKGGSVILLVLFTILFAVYALTKFVERAAVELLSESRASVGDRLRLQAYSALEVTLAVLEDFRTVNGALRSPAEGWADPLAFAGYEPAAGLEVAVAFEDESAKIPLPDADFQTLTLLLMQLGLKQSDAERLADALLLWMRRDYEPISALSPRAIDYQLEAIPYAPPARSLRSLSEFSGIPAVREAFYDEAGQPNDLWRAFAASVSLFSYSQPNANGGNMAALAAVSGYDVTGIKNILDYLNGDGIYKRQGPAYFQASQDLGAIAGEAAMASRLGVQISALRVNVTVRDGQTSFRLSAVLAPPGGARIPLGGEGAAAGPNTGNSGSAGSAPGAATASPATAASTGIAAGGGMPQTPRELNYPFTLLEIRENDEIPDLSPSGDNPRA